MRFFIFFLLLFLCLAKASYLLAEPRNEEPFQLATLFCPEGKLDKNGKCTQIYFDEDPGVNLQDATVRISGSGICSGVVIQLMRNGTKCETPLLLTVGHCVDHEKIEKIKDHIAFGNHKIYEKLKLSVLKTLQKKCVRSGDYPQGKNCLLTPQDILNNDDTQTNFSGVDQALIPLKNVKANLPSVKVDLNSLVREDDLAECLKGQHEATVVSYLTMDHFRAIKQPIPEIEENYIKADTCNDLSFLTKTPNNIKPIKPIIGHRCPTLKGMSGSFFGLSCKTQNKRALLVYQGQNFQDISKSLKEKAEKGESIPYSQYEGNENFKNTVTYIDPSLIDLYVDEYCGFPNPPR